jgi:hypothetical protein
MNCSTRMIHIRFLLMITAATILCSCATTTQDKPFDGPYLALDADRVDDLLPPRDSEDMRELLLTLPIFESSPARRRPWVFATARVRPTSILLEGDGAQATLMLARDIRGDTYQLEIGPHEDSVVSCYKLQRVSGGWIILNRKRRLVDQAPT